MRPGTLELGECKVHHQVLVTTLHDHRCIGKDDLSQRYARRRTSSWIVAT